MRLLIILIAMTLLPHLPGTSLSQESRAVILGRVTDGSGGGIVGAKVQVKSLATGADSSSVTGSDGAYQIPYMIPGQYKITVTAQGFKTALREQVDLRVGERVALDFTLEVGVVAETVQITSEAPLVDSASASSGMVIDGRRASELPTVGGNAFYLSRLAPGVLTTGGRSAGNPFDYGSGTGSAVVNGTRAGASEVSLDGASNMFERNTAYSPPQDLVAEFKIQTTSYDASVGHASGAVTNVSIKSGTKDLHGTGYFNDSRLRAVPWHTNRFLYDPSTGPINDEKLSRNVPTWLHQRWGATATGPVVIPRLYDGRQKTFWVFGYEGLNIKRNLSFTGTVPTEAQRRGDFSSLLALGPNYQIYDPATIQPAAGGRFRRQPFAGNVIPSDRIDTVAKKILEFWPLPNQPGTADGRNNYFTTQDIERSNRSVLARVDHNFSEAHRLFVRFNHNRQFDTTIPFESESVGSQAIQPGYGAVVDDVYTFDSTLTLNLRYGLSYQKPIAGRVAQGFDLLSLGFPRSLLDEINAKSSPAGITFPNIRVDNTASPDNPVYTALGTDGGNFRTIYTHSFSGIVTKIVGSHSLKTGAEYRLMRENGFNFGSVSPRIDFGGAWTRGPLDNSPTAQIGQGFASFLLGVPTGGSVSINSSRAQQSDWTGVFIHDDWRVNSKLTVNLGIRYEYESAPTERFNRTIRGFDFSATSPISALALQNYAANPIPEVPVTAFRTLGGLTFAGVNGQPRGLWGPDKNNFLPRIGLAYSLTKKTVLRAGYGVYFDSIGVDRIDVNQGGFNQTTNVIPTLDNGRTFIAALSDPFPNGFQLPAGSSQGLSTFLGRSVSFFNERPLNPYIQRWSLSVQQELPGRVVAEVSYVGSRGTKLGVERNLNPIPRQYLSTKNERDGAVIDFLSEAVRNPFFGIPEFAGSGLAGRDVARSQLLRPYPHFQDITVIEPSGYSWYHALQVGVEKRLAKGLTFQASWTYSKFMEAISHLNDTDPRPEEVISDQDFPHRFALNGIYELPFGKGRRWFNENKWVDYALGGWQLQGWFEGQSGEALGFGNAIVRGNLRDLVLPAGKRSSEQWFNLAAANTVFERSNALQLANNVRTLSSRFGFIRADGVNNFDLSLFKNFQISEGVRLQFRAESFNALNHVQFASPNTTVTNTAFGSTTGEKGHGQRQFTFGLKVLF
jgi:carboxypeptidase family protein/TonB-dependent receptor-like protein